MIAKKMYIRLLKHLDNILVGEKQEIFGNSYWGNYLDELFERYKFRNEYLDLNDYLNERVGIDFKDMPFSEGYSDLDEDEKTNFVVAIYNIYYFSDENQEIKQRLYSFFNRLGIIFSNDLEYKEATIASKIGEGAYAQVIEINENFVYKQLKKEYWNTKDVVSRFKAEFKTQDRLKENNSFLNVFDYDEVENKYMMDRGEMNLEDYLEKDNQNLDRESKLQIILQILSKIKYAHDEGIIHRDLHIGNILKKNNEFYIVDFGFAKDEKVIRSRMTSSSTRLTHFFIAPEGYKSIKELDKLSDIYSLGKIIDWLMSNDLSFESDHELKYIVAKCCSKQKTLRYDSVDELILAIKERVKQKNDVVNQELLKEQIKTGEITPEIEEYLNRLVKLNRVAANIYENDWKKFDEVITKITDKGLRTKLIDNLFENGVTSTRYNQWQDYDTLGTIAYKLLITNEFDPNVEKQLCEILNNCSGRFNIQDLIQNVITDYSTPLREEHLEVF